MQILSKATERFLKPLQKDRLGDAILRLSLPEKHEDEEISNTTLSEVKHFCVEIYEERDNGDGTVAETAANWYASSFVEQRFKHGFRRSSSRGIMHRKYFVPATDYSLYLFLYTWTGKRVVSPNARPLLEKMIATENVLAQSAKRNATFKERLATELERYNAAKKAHQAHDPPLPIDGIEKPNDAMLADPEFMQRLELSPYVTNPPEAYVKANKPTLTVAQQVCATNAIECPGYHFYKEVGCGKTAPAIRTMDFVTSVTHVTAKRPARILIILPKNIRHNWIDEIAHFSFHDYKVSILQGPNESVRKFKLVESLVDTPGQPKKGHVVIAGYETAAATELLKAIEWDLLILDEVHSIANPSTKRTKFCLALRDSSAKRIGLSGTPIRNILFDLYAQFEYLYPGGSGMQSFNAFKTFHGNWKQIPGKGVRVLEEMKNIPLAQERLAKMSFVMKMEEAQPSLPERRFDTLECSLSQEQVRIYREVALMLQAQLEQASQGGEPDAVTVNNHLTKMLRLAEITSGYAATDESGTYRFDPNNKLEMMVEEIKEHLDNNPNSKVQIWCVFRENIRQIRARLALEYGDDAIVTFYGATKDEDRQIAKDRFNKDTKCRVFIGSPGAGGQGLNLLGFDPYNPNDYETNCDWVIHYSQNFNTVFRRQADGRSYRTGTRVSVRVTDLMVPGSIDEVIIQRVKQKIDDAMTIQDLRKILANALSPITNGD